jgi:multiple antibiotic resistance protein
MEIPLFTVIVILFLIMDPIGSISSFLGMVKELPESRIRWIVFREMMIALAFMLAFNFLGEFIFDILQLDKQTVDLASGAILFLTAIKILFPASNSLRANLPAGEPFVIPLAVPLIAGPSLLATIMLLAHLETSITYMLSAIFIAWFVALLVLLFAKQIQRVLGNNGLMAFERLTGMLLVMLAVQRCMVGIQEFITMLSAK